MISVAKGFLSLHGDSGFSMKNQKEPDKLFSTYTLLYGETVERFKNPGKSWSWIEKRNLMKFLMK